METAAAESGLAEPHLAHVLASVGLNVEYVRAEGTTLHRLDGDGREVPVLDLVGGFGSLILGHNHPEIVAYARDLLAARIPVHAQFSDSPHAGRLAAALNAVLRRELGDDEPYFAIFASTGAEAIEAAIKHAEFDRHLTLAALAGEIADHAGQVRAAVGAGDAIVPDDAFDLAAPIARPDGVTDRRERLERLVAQLDDWNSRQLARAPLFLVAEKAFHGKLVGSVQLTHNEAFRVPFEALAAQARFLPLDRPEAIQEAVDAERGVLFDLTIANGLVTVVERDFPIFCAFVLEPIQGEGGINVVPPEFGKEARRVCDSIGCPLIVDEIQSGMGRTGAFLASTRVGLRGDYYTLAKSLGGGIAKTSVALVRASRYRKEFELVHSSTFAKDAFSSLVALKVLELLEAGGGAAYRVIEERGRRLSAMLGTVREAFPDVVKDVRGMGLMLGVEFHDRPDSTSPIIQDLVRNGFLGYAVAGHVLREHRIRTFPTGSAANTLRLEPSLQLSDEEITRLESALRDVCAVLRDEDGPRLMGAA
ncbi:aspartate aminotransferase family protein [Actinomadura sp. 3N508]|uniref:aspartate aminotransferase family protein n=1 Tax=Actinomadura sp. 3N508 TaxID=3375153 RepID=UPI00378754FD